jgi:hypothetical protein
MEKPVIFFSHSSKDKEYLLTLKNKLLTKTSNTIEIFHSSDGESIPFGNNWLHKIEEKLMNSKIMFVFISPNSVRSNWIYFESGFSYSKGIKVIPIGIDGIDIGKLAPPINLLQGFNIYSHEGLNNLIAIINKEFSNSFIDDFTNDDYEDILGKSNNITNNYSYLDYVDYIETQFHKRLTANELNASAFTNIETFLTDNNIKHTKDNMGRFYFHGMVISKKNDDFIIKIDPIRLFENVAIINKLVPIVYVGKIFKYWIYVYFNDNVDLLTTDFKLSSRLGNIGLEMSKLGSNLYEYKNISFALDEKYENTVTRKFEKQKLRIIYSIDTFNEIEVYELINILFENKIILIR